MLERYSLRLLVWPIILVQIRGETPVDEIKLVISAMASLILSLRDLDRWQDPILLFDTSVEVNGIGKFRLRPWCDDLWHVLPWRERAVVRTVRGYLKPGDVFVDAGANIGFYSVLASKIVGDQGQIVAIEMMPDTAHVLRQHLDLNNVTKATVVQKALSNEPDLQLSAQRQKGKFGQASIAVDVSFYDETVDVETTTLKKLLQSLPDVAIMKMDLEGAEKHALDGADELINNIRSIIVEDWGDKSEVKELIESYGYRVTELDGRNFLATRQSGGLTSVGE